MSTAHPQTGRSDTGAVVSGPRAATYNSISFYLESVAASTTRIVRFLMPTACRIMEVSSVYDVLTGAAPDYQLSNQTDAVDVIATRALPAADTFETITPTSTPALLNRDFDKGDILRLTITAGAGEAVADLTMLITVWVRGHAVALPDND